MSIQAVLLAIALMLGAGVLAEPVAEVLRLPRMLVCIAAGAALGPSGLRWVDVPLGSRGTQVALSLGVAIVLFHGGLQLSARVLAQVAPGLTMLAIVGVVATAVIVGSVAAAAFGLPIRSGLIVGAVLAPTDPAILIPIFDRLRVAPKIAQTIIAESALNDPAGALLTLVLAGMVVHTGSSTAHSLREYLVEVVVAALAGLAVGAGFSCLASSHRAGRLWRNLAPSGCSR